MIGKGRKARQAWCVCVEDAKFKSCPTVNMKIIETQ